MIILDTTVLVYAKGEHHPLRDPCRELIEAIADGRLEASTTVEVIQEFVHVRARRRNRIDAATLGEDYANLLSPLLTVTDEHLQQGLSLFAQLETLGAFDAVLAAAARTTQARAIVSADAAFANVSELSHIVPNVEGVASLLSV